MSRLGHARLVVSISTLAPAARPPDAMNMIPLGRSDSREKSRVRAPALRLCIGVPPACRRCSTLAADVTMHVRLASRTPPYKSRFYALAFPRNPCPVCLAARFEASAPIRPVQNALEIWRELPESARKPCWWRVLLSPNRFGECWRVWRQNRPNCCRSGKTPDTAAPGSAWCASPKVTWARKRIRSANSSPPPPSRPATRVRFQARRSTAGCDRPSSFV